MRLRLGLLLLVVAVVACAPAQKVMVYHPGESDTEVVHAWPAPDQLPRLEYAGELIGERNFVTVQGSEGRGRKLLRWLTGLGRFGDQELRLVRPLAGIVDANGRILVTDAGRPSVFVFDALGGSLDVWTKAAPNQDFVAPVGIAADGRGGFLVSDSELGAVFRLDATGEPTGRFEVADLVRPTGLGVDATTGDVYIADAGAHDVKVYSASGAMLRVMGVPGDDGSAPGQLNAPVHVEVSGERVYVTDALNASVQIFGTRDGEPVAAIGRRGLYVGNLVRPKGITTDNDGNVYVVESYYDHLLVFDADGRFLLPLGGTGSGPGRFFLPAGAWSDPQDRIFVADMFNGRVVIFRFRGQDG